MIARTTVVVLCAMCIGCAARHPAKSPDDLFQASMDLDMCQHFAAASASIKCVDAHQRWHHVLLEELQRRGER